MHVEAHLNLHRVKQHKQNCISVRERKTGAKVKHVGTLRMTDVEFIVQPAGRAEAVASGQRNVHAFVRGVEKCRYRVQIAIGHPYRSAYKDGWIRVSYNPFKSDSFYEVLEGGEVGPAVVRAHEVHLSGKDCWARGVIYRDG